MTAWRNKIDFLRDHPKGPNYDLSQFDTFVPLIVTASPHFVYESLLEPRVFEDLRPVAAIDELAAFLQVRGGWAS